MLKNMLQICSESIFVYNNAVFKQQDGVAMGSPLAPLLAEWFVSKVENQVIDQSSCKPKYYRRYVDDIFALFDSTSNRDAFFNSLNAAHPNLRFTMEVATTSLPFLDISVSINSEGFRTEVYRKPTYTGVIMNFDAMAPRGWKKALINCFLRRALTLSSHKSAFTLEVKKIEAVLRANSYPIAFTKTIIEKFMINNDINGHFSPNHPDAESTPMTADDDKRTTHAGYLLLPYFGHASVKLQKRIYDEFLQYDTHIRAAYSTTKTGSYFSLKTKVPPLFRANVVYKFTGSCDKNISYIGETRRQLFKRIEEHKSNKVYSAVFEHLASCVTCQNVPKFSDCFTILERGTRYNILAMESLCISRFQPSLNKQMGPSDGKLVTMRLYR